VEAGKAIVVNPQLASSLKPWQALMQRRANELPTWTCLDCNPGWNDVHQMAMQDLGMQMEKQNSVAAMQIDRAAELKDAQYRVRDRLVAAVARMLEGVDPS
jgi:hypothetical protein